MIPRVYTDTSVFGGCFDKEFEEWSIKLMDEFKIGLKILIVSNITIRELEKAPDHIKNMLDEIPDVFIEYVTLNNESLELSGNYINEGIVKIKHIADAQHIAIATVNRANILVSWNFKHIVNLTKIRLYNSVNLKYGYAQLEIRNPREVLYEKRKGF